jgi:NhaP-type Na+/H+ or K+/H+ antiporter
MALESFQSANRPVDTLVATATWTILLSVILHGLSAGPVAAWYGSRSAGFAPGSPELEPTDVIKTRHGVASPNSLEE